MKKCYLITSMALAIVLAGQPAWAEEEAVQDAQLTESTDSGEISTESADGGADTETQETGTEDSGAGEESGSSEESGASDESATDPELSGSDDASGDAASSEVADDPSTDNQDGSESNDGGVTVVEDGSVDVRNVDDKPVFFATDGDGEALPMENARDFDNPQIMQSTAPDVRSGRASAVAAFEGHSASSGNGDVVISKRPAMRKRKPLFGRNSVFGELFK